MQTELDKKYLILVGYFYHVNVEWKVLHLSDTYSLGEMSHLIKETPKFLFYDNRMSS